MLHTKFRKNLPARSGEDFLVVFTIHGRGGHLGHVTWISQSIFRNPYPWMLHGCSIYKLFILVGWGRSFLSVAWPTGVQLVFFFCSGVSRLFGAQGSPSSGSLLSL